MEDFRKLLLTHATHLKYGLLFLFIFSMIISIRTYLNYISIEETIEVVKEDVGSIQEEILYTEKFLLKYLSSDYADYFLAHENNILFGSETIIRFDFSPQKTEEIIPEKDETKEYFLQNPQASWKHFWREKFQTIR